jgi:hypothetical protein
MRFGDNQLTYASLFTIHDAQNANHSLQLSEVLHLMPLSSRPVRGEALRRCSLGMWFACVITMQRHPFRASKLTLRRVANVNADRP